jgi:uncharacterized cupin superfamily protein
MKIVHSNDVPWNQQMDRGRFSGQRKDLGGERLKSGLWQLPPGKRSFPLHTHAVTEEALFVLSGSAKVRTTEGETPIGPGDYVSFPPGGPAHQLINEGSEPLVYLAMSAVQTVDIIEYPDSGKVACAIVAGPERRRLMFKKDQQVDYFDGEE